MSRTFTGIVRGKFLYDGSKTIDDMVDVLVEEIALLRKMRDAGIRLREEANDDYVFIETDDPEVAHQFGLKEEK